MSSSSQKFVRCPKCGERLGVRAEDVGRRARCSKCAHVFTIGGQAPAGQPAKPATPSPVEAMAALAAKTDVADPAADSNFSLEPEAPQWISFHCSLCDTRMSAMPSQVGEKFECPDCGRKNVVPPPPKPKAPVVPAAMSGDQFGLYAADEKTWEPGFIKDVPLHPNYCRVCQTLMYATDEQIGHDLKCPDCGALTKAKPAEKKTKPTLRQPVGEDLELDPASAPTPRPKVNPMVTSLPAETQAAAALAMGSKGKLKPAIAAPVYEERPEMPAVPLVQGVWSMLLSEEIFARWAMMSVLFGIAGWLFATALGGGKVTIFDIMGIFLMLLGMGVAILWLTFAAPTFLAIVGESSDGNRKLQDPPGWSPFEWLGEVGFMMTAVGMAFMPGMIAVNLPGLPQGMGVLILLCTAPLIFPIALLGAMAENSAFGILSPRIMGSLFKCPHKWLLFYLETALIVAAVAAAGYGIYLWIPDAVVLLIAPIAMAASLLVMRLLGRLAWWLSESLVRPEDELPEEIDHGAAAHPHLAASREAARAERLADIAAVKRGKRAAAEAAAAEARAASERGKDQRQRRMRNLREGEGWTGANPKGPRAFFDFSRRG